MVVEDSAHLEIAHEGMYFGIIIYYIKIFDDKSWVVEQNEQLCNQRFSIELLFGILSWVKYNT